MTERIHAMPEDTVLEATEVDREEARRLLWPPDGFQGAYSHESRERVERIAAALAARGPAR